MRRKFRLKTKGKKMLKQQLVLRRANRNKNANFKIGI